MDNNFIDELKKVAGSDVAIPFLGVVFHQPKLREVALLGEKKFFYCLSTLTTTKKDLKMQNQQVSNYQIVYEFYTQIKDKKSGIMISVVDVKNFMKLFLPDFDCMFSENAMSLIPTADGSVISFTDDQFEVFQLVLGNLGGREFLGGGAQEETFNPGNSEAKRIADKILAMRAKRKALQAAEEGDKSTQSIFGDYAFILSTVTATSFENVLNMTLYQIDRAVKSYLAFEEYDLDISSRLAGAESKEKLTHWTQRLRGKSNNEVSDITTSMTVA